MSRPQGCHPVPPPVQTGSWRSTRSTRRPTSTHRANMACLKSRTTNTPTDTTPTMPTLALTSTRGLRHSTARETSGCAIARWPHRRPRSTCRCCPEQSMRRPPARRATGFRSRCQPHDKRCSKAQALSSATTTSRCSTEAVTRVALSSGTSLTDSPERLSLPTTTVCRTPRE